MLWKWILARFPLRFSTSAAGESAWESSQFASTKVRLINFNCDPHVSYCPELTSLCSPQASEDYTQHCKPCTIWPNYKYKLRTHRHSKFGSAPFICYINSTATFHILLTVSGDIEVNPGPVKDPCGRCSRPVKCNKRFLLCEDCNKFWH